VPELAQEDRDYCGLAAGALEWTDDPWRALTTRLKEETGRKGKSLFLPLRLALTGQASGPDMGELLPLIGEDAARTRLEAAARGA
jgi:glutamyl-tRNA synthetase